MQTSADGGASQTYFDVLGRETRGLSLGFDGLWDAVDTEYDTAGRIARKSEPFDVGAGSGLNPDTGYDVQNLEYDWDALGNLEWRKDLSGPKNLTEEFVYDELNRLKTQTVRIGPDIVQTIGDSNRFGVGAKIMIAGADRLAGPCAPRIGKLADELFLPRVDANDRLAIRLEIFAQPCFGRWVADREATAAEQLGDFLRRRSHPFRDRIARHFVLHQRLDLNHQLRRFFIGRRPPPALRIRSRSRSSASSSFLP
jgi:hypothetical protein